MAETTVKTVREGNPEPSRGLEMRGDTSNLLFSRKPDYRRAIRTAPGVASEQVQFWSAFGGSCRGGCVNNAGIGTSQNILWVGMGSLPAHVPENSRTSVFLPRWWSARRSLILPAVCFYGDFRHQNVALLYPGKFRDGSSRKFCPPFPV